MKILATIYIASFLVSLGSYFVAITIPIYLTQWFAANPLQIGIIGFLSSFMYTLISFALIKLRSARKFPLFIYVPIGIGITYFLLPFYTSILPFIPTFALMGAFYAGLWPSMQYCLQISGKDEISVVFYNLSWSGGVIIGALFGGNLYEINSVLPYFTAAGLVFLAAALLLCQKSIFTSQYHKNVSREQIRETPKTSTEITKVRILNFLNFLTMGAILFLFPRLSLDIGYTPAIIGKLIAVTFITRFLVFILLKKIRIGKVSSVFLASCIAISICCILIALGKTPKVHAISMVILGISTALTYHMSITRHIKEGYLPEIHEGFIGAGLFMGPLIAGCLGQLFNLQTAFIIIGIGLLSAGIYQQLTLHKQNHVKGLLNNEETAQP